MTVFVAAGSRFKLKAADGGTLEWKSTQDLSIEHVAAEIVRLGMILDRPSRETSGLEPDRG